MSVAIHFEWKHAWVPKTCCWLLLIAVATNALRDRPSPGIAREEEVRFAMHVRELVWVPEMVIFVQLFFSVAASESCDRPGPG